jgi:hypothetical protein
VEVLMSPSLVAKEIEATKIIFDLLVDLYGVTNELLKVHNFANVIEVPLCPIKFSYYQIYLQGKQREKSC